MKWYHWLGLLLLLAVIGVPGYFLFHGPHMKIQPHILAYQAVLPTIPAGTVPMSSPLPQVPSTQQAQGLRNPLPATEANLQRGQVYYTYYCVFCHGEKGDGTGPVGDSYVPRPTDLREPRVQAYPDGQLLRAMLTGNGHEPVLGRTVPREDYWYLALFVRQFGLRSSTTAPAATTGPAADDESAKATASERVGGTG